MYEHVVVVGAGVAGQRAAIGLRTKGFEGRLTVVGAETHLPYDRPPLSKTFLAGERSEAELALGPEIAEVDWKLGSAAVGLDPAAKLLSLASGETVGYDALIVATGRRARPWPTAVPDGVLTLRTLEDSVALREAAGPDTRVAIVGAGFIGSEVASTLRGRGVERVCLIDVLDQPIAPLGPELGSRVAAAHRDHGVELRLGVGVAELRGNGRVTGVALEDGSVVDAELVLLALGAIPNAEWLESAGVGYHRGSVVCEPTLAVRGLEDVWAVGDVAAWPDPVREDHLSVEHWTNAREMATLAVTNLLADPAERRPYVGVPSFWSDIYDLAIKSAGPIADAERLEIVEDDPATHGLVAEARRGEELVGVVTINRNREMFAYTKQLAAARAAA